MPKLPRLSGAQVCRILQDHGFRQVRQRGSHIVMQLTRPGTTVTVPVPNRKELKPGTFRSIIRQSGLMVEDFSR